MSKYTPFGKEVRAYLTSSNTTQLSFAKGLSVTSPYISHLMTGKRNPSSRWVDLIADAMNATPEQRRDLHHKAAQQKGFKL